MKRGSLGEGEDETKDSMKEGKEGFIRREVEEKTNPSIASC